MTNYISMNLNYYLKQKNKKLKHWILPAGDALRRFLGTNPAKIVLVLPLLTSNNYRKSLETSPKTVLK